MKIERALLINPPSGLYRRDDRCQSKVEDQTVAVIFPPIELAYLAAILEQQGVICQIQDYPVTGSDWDIFRAHLHQFQPQMLVINATTPTMVTDLQSATIAKSVDPEIITVARSEYFSFYDERVLNDFPHVDILLRGEAELTIAELVTASDLRTVSGITFRSEKNEIIRNPDRPLLANLDILPFPARHLLDNRLYRSPENDEPITVIQTSRGCPARCIFCSAPLVAGYKVRMRSPENVVAEVEECVTQFGIKNFLFNADTFTWDKNWVIDLCRKLVAMNLDIRWGANSRVDTVDLEMLQWMKKAGCWVVGYGIESGSQELLNKMKKGITLDKIRTAISLTKQAKLKTHAFYVFGLPWETETTIRETIRLAKELDTDFFDFNIVYPLPGTELYALVQEENLFVVSDASQASYATPAVRSYSLSPKQLEKYRKSALWQLYLRPHYIFRTLFTAGSPRIMLNYLRFAYRRTLNLLKN
ncbi:MAG: B12-binding domain-containing radical SAM protein [bacterium]|nr:B12-binding domain-containing radical SAM protein [bacterium]